MTDPNNPFDKTIWDPGNPEHAIEDPFHGPSAIHDMLQTPAMPLGDGRYYQPGASYTLGTNYLDSQDRPFPLVIGRGVIDSMREGHDLREWLEAYHEGKDQLTALEAKRQNQRLNETGFAHCFKPSDVCPGGNRLEDCEIGSKAYEAAQEWACDNNETFRNEGTISNVISWLGGKCSECSVSCEVAVKTVEGEAQETRVSYFRPREDMRTIFLEQNEPRELSAEESAKLKAHQKPA